MALPTEPMSGAELAAERKRRGLSQTAFATEIGRTRKVVSLWETENKCRPPKWLRRWFKGYDAQFLEG